MIPLYKVKDNLNLKPYNGLNSACKNVTLKSLQERVQQVGSAHTKVTFIHGIYLNGIINTQDANLYHRHPNRDLKYITVYTEQMTRMPENLRQKALQNKS
jgi:hypothetical protein